MTKEFFEKLCEDNDISWNDKVVITVYNPFKKWYKFREPKFYKFNGYLLYHDGDENVKVSVVSGKYKITDVFYDFEQILNIEKYENL